MKQLEAGSKYLDLGGLFLCARLALSFSLSLSLSLSLFLSAKCHDVLCLNIGQLSKSRTELCGYEWVNYNCCLGGAVLYCIYLLPSLSDPESIYFVDGNGR